MSQTTGPRIIPRTTTLAERAINCTRAEHQRNLEIKIENLQELAQKQLDNVIEDMLPKYGLVLHPTHPRFAQEYPILADILRRQNDRVDIQAEQEKKNPFTIYPLTKAFSERNNLKKKDTWQTQRNSDSEYHHPTFTPTFQYEQINQLPQGDARAWRTPTHRTPLHYDKQKTFQ
jgi:hypothetical protein